MAVSCYDLNYWQNGINLVIQKGYEGNERVVNQLVKEGGCLHDGVHGYAFGGHHDLVIKVLSQNPELKSAAALGYARAKNIKEATKFSKIKEYKSAVIYGFTLAGDENQIRAVLNSKDLARYLPMVIDALASTNQSRLLLELVENSIYFSKAIQAAAKSGHRELVECLLNRLAVNIKTLNPITTPIPLNDQTALGYALSGYSEGRHFPEAAEILELGINPMHCLSALALNGKLDATDASLLLSAVTNSEIKESLKKLMETQFALELEQLDLTLILKSDAKHPF